MLFIFMFNLSLISLRSSNALTSNLTFLGLHLTKDNSKTIVKINNKTVSKISNMIISSVNNNAILNVNTYIQSKHLKTIK